MNCKLCGEVVLKIQSHLILNKYDVSYFQCKRCGLIFTENPYWIDEAYSSAIAAQDTGIIQRNIINARNVSRILHALQDRNGIYLDYGGGPGTFVRLMRDKGYDFLWYDKYSMPIFSKGFEYRGQDLTATTAFEVFEHLVDVKEEIEKMLDTSDFLLFSTICYDKKITPPPTDWWYFVYEEGQHVAFYSEQTFRYLAKEYNRSYYKIMGYHVLASKQVSKFKLIYLNLLNLFYKYIIDRKKFVYCVEDMKTINNLLH